MPIQSCGQSVSAWCGKQYTVIGLFKVNAHTDARQGRRRCNVGGVLVLNEPPAMLFLRSAVPRSQSQVNNACHVIGYRLNQKKECQQK